MYEEYFGLKRPPFRITPDTSLFYDGGQRGDILGALVYAVHRGEGIVKVVGEVGSGKTMLCRMLQQELPDDVEIIYIANPSVSAEDILFVIANELHFNIAKNASKHEVVSMLHEYLLKKHAENRQVVLFVEEAQGMPLETLEEIRLLSNLETDQHKLLQIILFGQPELDQNLADNSIRQLRERITHDFQLSPLTPEQIHSYLNFRMREVGYTGPELISKKLARNMADSSEGLLRRINILADKMLLSAFADNTHTLSTKHLNDAVKDSGFTRLHNNSQRRLKWLIGGSLLLLIAAVLYAAINSYYFFSPLKTTASSTGSGIASKNLSTPVVKETTEAEAEVLIRDTGHSENRQNPASLKLQNDKIQKVLETASTLHEEVSKPDLEVTTKKVQQSVAILDKVAENQAVEAVSSSETSEVHESWLNNKIRASKEWLKEADKQGVSIQVMMRSKSAGKELAMYLQNEWPLELDKTYLYEVNINNQQIYRVFYNEYPSIPLAQMKMKQLPESVRRNSPYLHSISRMQKALL
jgi:type II secretory pathway predicted ATPase ExeA/septal ring-binding cell division protein DamX